MHSMAAKGDCITKLLFGASRPAADSLSCVTARHENEIIPGNLKHTQSGRRRLLDMSSREPEPPCERFEPVKPEAVILLSVPPYGMGGCSKRLGWRPEGAALLRHAKKVRRLPATTAALTACTQ
jgi:hypothetical protein